jgi:hypothetical protein
MLNGETAVAHSIIFSYIGLVNRNLADYNLTGEIPAVVNNLTALTIL